jgi:hypothetical protein
MQTKFKPGQIIRHFKRDFISKEEKESNLYLYQVVGIALHSETKEPLLIYQGLYQPFQMYARPLAMAEEKTDKVKYPAAKQEYRLQIMNEEE